MIGCQTLTAAFCALPIIGNTLAVESKRADLPVVAERPNIIIFYADDLGYGEPGCYGGKEVPTPYIDSIAANGIRFSSGYVAAPLCSQSSPKDILDHT